MNRRSFLALLGLAPAALLVPTKAYSFLGTGIWTPPVTPVLTSGTFSSSMFFEATLRHGVTSVLDVRLAEGDVVVMANGARHGPGVLTRPTPDGLVVCGTIITLPTSLPLVELQRLVAV